MEVKNKIMYHIHKSNKYDELWQEGNVFTVDDNFYSECGLIIPNFNTDVQCTDGSLASLDGFLKDYLNNGIENLEQDTIRALLKDSYRIIHNTNRFKCEAALELCRKENFKLCPSRLHSIWVTDKDNIDFWLSILNSQEIFELDLTGNLFKTSDIYIPDNHMSFIEAIARAEDYWNPVFTKEAEEKKEYLFQGKVLIKKKISKN